MKYMPKNKNPLESLQKLFNGLCLFYGYYTAYNWGVLVYIKLYILLIGLHKNELCKRENIIKLPISGSFTPTAAEKQEQITNKAAHRGQNRHGSG